MKRIRIIIIFIPWILLSCSTINHKERELSNVRGQYEHYLNEYYNSGDISNVDSALKYNAVLLDSDSAGIVQYFNQIQLLYFCGRYDSILSFIDRIPKDVVSWAPEYKSYLRLKSKAVMAKDFGDTINYIKFLDSIIEIWEPVILDSIAKTDSLFSKPVDSIPFHLWVLYENYYKTVSLLHGKDSVNLVFAEKNKRFNWNRETYTLIRLSANGDAEPSLP
jgi:hypothetical protein